MTGLDWARARRIGTVPSAAAAVSRVRRASGMDGSLLKLLRLIRRAPYDPGWRRQSSIQPKRPERRKPLGGSRPAIHGFPCSHVRCLIVVLRDLSAEPIAPPGLGQF